MKTRTYKHLFGPVPSRRLGRSLGVDLVPFKVCPFDCLYCQLGRTTRKTALRREYIPTDEILAELRTWLASGVGCDYITLSGSGEPTLHSRLERIIAAIKDATDIPLAVLTNAALLSDPEVRRALLRADLVAPSLDAGDEKTFARINRPCAGLSLRSLVEGLEAFRREYAGVIRLEVFLADGVNTDEAQLQKIKHLIDRIRPDRIDINTVARPPAEEDLRPADAPTLQRAREIFGPSATIIAPCRSAASGTRPISQEDVWSLLQRRPCTLEDLAAGLGRPRQELMALLKELCASGAVRMTRQADGDFYQLSSPTRD